MSDNKPNCKIVELFSGIGSQAKALKNLGYDVTTLGTCEWDLHAFIAYDAIHNSPEISEKTLKMSKEELLEALQAFTLSNNGKEPMEYKTLKTYSVDSLRSELSKKVVEIDGFKEEYRELMDELKKMKNIIDEKVYKGKWWLFRLLIR